MYEKTIVLLEQNNIDFEKGLSAEELVQIEKIYNIQFPKSLREFLMAILPISKGFYNWRDTTQDNVNYINKVMQAPFFDLVDLVEEIYWCDGWGIKPREKEIFEKEVKKRLNEAPKLIPIFAHRYMPMIPAENPPILSVCGVDIIYYGENLENYFEIEFGKRKQETIEVCMIEPIPFWSDLI